MKIKNIYILFCSLLSASVLIGCVTQKDLAPGGVYNGDAYLYNIDKTIVTTYQTVDAFLVWELSNNSYIKTNIPSVFDFANKIRDNAPVALSDVSKARTLYVNYFHSPASNLVSFASVSNNLQQQVNILKLQAQDISVIALSSPLSNSYSTTLDVVQKNPLDVNTILK